MSTAPNTLSQNQKKRLVFLKFKLYSSGELRRFKAELMSAIQVGQKAYLQ